jgi:hypothetical protein
LKQAGLNSRRVIELPCCEIDTYDYVWHGVSATWFKFEEQA